MIQHTSHSALHIVKFTCFIIHTAHSTLHTAPFILLKGMDIKDFVEIVILRYDH